MTAKGLFFCIIVVPKKLSTGGNISAIDGILMGEYT